MEKKINNNKNNNINNEENNIDSKITQKLLSSTIEELNKELHDPNLKLSNKYTVLKILGKGTFGIVYEVKNEETNEIFAIKKVYQDSHYKNRELQIMKELNHPNIIKLNSYFFTKGENDNETYLSCIMEFIPETLSNIIRKYAKEYKQMEEIYVKLYSFQMIKSLAYIHAKGICHRDIKPQNILINLDTHQLKLCDFGSAKKLIKGQLSIAYICSRYYRAPELAFGSREYTNEIDMWSIGCVIGELVLGRPLFPGKNASDQLVEIIKILGTPSKEDIIDMNPKFKDHKFPNIKPYSWEKVFKLKIIPKDFIDLIEKMLVYSPVKRITAMKALCHPFFDELKNNKNLILPNGKKLPEDLFVFTEEEIKSDEESAKILMNNNNNI